MDRSVVFLDLKGGCAPCDKPLMLRPILFCPVPVSYTHLLPDRTCFVTTFRQGGYTPLRRLCGYPLCTCRPQTVLTNRLPPASLKIRHKQILRMV